MSARADTGSAVANASGFPAAPRVEVREFQSPSRIGGCGTGWSGATLSRSTTDHSGTYSCEFCATETAYIGPVVMASGANPAIQVNMSLFNMLADGGSTQFVVNTFAPISTQLSVGPDGGCFLADDFALYKQ